LALEPDAQRTAIMGTPEREWAIEFDDAEAISRLRIALLLADQADTKSGLPDDALVLVVDRFAGLRVEVFAREHPPPHFRVSCGQDSANYRIKDCVQLNGGLLRHNGTVRAWHPENRERLIAKWNQHRPTDCPVGKYREV